MSERRYSDDEVRRIIALAAEAEAAAGTPAARPWRLDEVERIGVEAGLARESIAAAAHALERQPPDAVAAAPARWLGLPVAVSRTVPLARHLSDEDWARLVGHLRETFAAEGRTRVTGAQREWRVGNLRVTHEPVGDGAVLQLRTRKGDARAFAQVGGVLLLVTVCLVAVTLLRSVVDGEPIAAPPLGAAALTAVFALLAIALGALRLPGWARTRERQFEALGAWARRTAGEVGAGDDAAARGRLR